MKDPIAIVWRKRILLYSLIGMMASLFCSRALLALFMILFVSAAILHGGIKQQVRDFLSSPLLWSMSLLFFLTLISGLWSSDKEEWLGVTKTKLPLLFLPLAFAGPSRFSKKEWEFLAYLFIALVSAGTIWSMFHYVTNLAVVHEGYLRAKSILTPLDNNRIQFSWMVSVTALLAGWLGMQKRISSAKTSGILFVVALWLIIFLHILAVRTGLISFYLVAIIILLRSIINKTKPLLTVLLVSIVVALPVIAYKVLPTFQNRVKYFLYDMSYFRETKYLAGSNDAVRIISLKAGWELMNDHPVGGVGSGDVLAETKKWYRTHYPEMIEADQIFPSSEWLIYGTACGWPGLVLFTCIVIVPFLLPMKHKLLWQLMNLTAAFNFLFDIGLEVQFGVFLYSFIVLWWWKWLKDGPNGSHQDVKVS